MLPKVRKDVSESLEEAAVRETSEEKGIRVKLHPVKMATLATLPCSSSSTQKDEEGLAQRVVTEPIAMTQRTVAPGVGGFLKVS